LILLKVKNGKNRGKCDKKTDKEAKTTKKFQNQHLKNLYKKIIDVIYY